MWESRRFFGEISKGLVGRVGSRFLAFHTFHSPGISTALFFWLRLRFVGRGLRAAGLLLRTRVFLLLAVL
jgi:hypothetical protein